MQTTMDLLAKAETIKDLSAWAKTLGLAKRTLYTAKYRGSLSPAVAGALAEELGEEAGPWMLIAALEGERDSACKSRMVRKFLTGAAIAGTLMGASGAATAAVANVAQSAGDMYIMLNIIPIERSANPFSYATQDLLAK